MSPLATFRNKAGDMINNQTWNWGKVTKEEKNAGVWGPQ